MFFSLNVSLLVFYLVVLSVAECILLRPLTITADFSPFSFISFFFMYDEALPPPQRFGIYISKIVMSSDGPILLSLFNMTVVQSCPTLLNPMDYSPWNSARPEY